jgi:peptidoglycan hydrolase-like protein with peptidoglycan-binding domain
MRQNKYQESPKTNFGEVTDALVKYFRTQTTLTVILFWM